jgi:hypothetical protein
MMVSVKEMSIMIGKCNVLFWRIIFESWRGDVFVVFIRDEWVEGDGFFTEGKWSREYVFSV